MPCRDSLSRPFRYARQKCILHAVLVQSGPVLHVAVQIILEHACAEYGSQHQDQAPVLLLHGFDSSSLEFRRLLPLLERSLEAWAVDLVGWGFSDSGAASQSNMKLGPKQKRDHLYAFWKEKVNDRTCCEFVLKACCSCLVHPGAQAHHGRRSLHTID